MAEYWIKLHHEILDDPKMGRLPDHLYRRVIELFLLAGSAHGDGLLPPIEDIAWRLRVTVEELEKDLQTIAATGILTETEDGWIVTNFAKRQEKLPKSEYMRRMRANEKIETYQESNNNSYQTVTKGNTDIDIESDIESESDDYDDEPKKSQNPNIFTLYEQNIGILTPIIAEKLKAAEKEYPHDWFPWAFGQAVSNNARSWAYIDACLKNRRDGKDHIPRARSPSRSNKDPGNTNDQVIADVARNLAKGLATNARK